MSCGGYSRSFYIWWLQQVHRSASPAYVRFLRGFLRLGGSSGLSAWAIGAVAAYVRVVVKSLSATCGS